MTKEIIVNAGELESRVAVLENGRLMELHVEREPKIIGNIYKARVTKVLKGMDAAFVDIGVERNAFLSASDVVPEGEEEADSHGRHGHRHTPPITQLLHANQEILVQVVRAPMGTKGARITTRLSLPGRYMVLMLNSGSYTGVSRKIDDPKERQRLRGIAERLRPEGYSLIVRTEAEGRTEEELQQDLVFLLDMARRIESKAAHTSAPSLVHGDLTLIYRLIRDAFTRDINRLVVDSPDAYENVMELVELIAPRLKNRVFLYDEPMPVFHAYNIEPEIERTLRRKVWLPSGGSLIIDQAEALTAIDVNTGRFVGSVELAETVLTTNLQAAEEAARQLRLRDLGGIIVVDFIDMDNPKHRAQVQKAFEEALKRDRAKIKMHNISALGLVEMTRKRTGESLAGLLTEPCPYCAGIGRVQNALTMALRIERDIAAAAAEHANTEAFLVTAHPRVIASMLGYEGEAQRDLEQYVGRPVYLRIEDEYHPNAYRLERLTLEQALAAVSRLEESEVVEARVVNPDPELSLSPLVQARGVYIVVPDLDAPVGALVKVRVRDVGTSLAIAEPLAAEQRGIRTEEEAFRLERPPLVPEAILPTYLREERAPLPPRGLPLLSPTAEAVPEPEVEIAPPPAPFVAAVEQVRERRRRRRGGRRRRGEEELVAESQVAGEALHEELAEEEVDLTGVMEDAAELAVSLPPVQGEEQELPTVPLEPIAGASRRRRRRRRSRSTGQAVSAEDLLAALPEGEEAGITEEAEEVAAAAGTITPLAETEAAADALTDALEEVPEEIEVSAVEAPAETLVEPPAPRRRRSSRRRRTATVEPTPTAEAVMLEPIMETISPEAATEALLSLLNAIPGPQGEEAMEPAVVTEEPAAEAPAEAPAEEAPAEAPKRRRATRARRRKAEAETALPAPEAVPALPPAEEPVATSTALPVVPEETLTPELPATVEAETVAPSEAAPEERPVEQETPAETTVPEAGEAVVVTPAPEEPAPKPRTRRRRTAAAPAEEGAEPKPRARRTRRKTTEEGGEETPPAAE